MTTLRHVLLLAGLLAAPLASADATVDGSGGDGIRGPGSVLSGRTLGAGENAALVQFGYPGISVGGLRGLTADRDVGASITFNYGFEGLPQISPGLKFQGTARQSFYDDGKLDFALRLDPGLLAYFRDPDSERFRFGLTVPVSAVVGISLGDALMLHFAADVPLALYFTPDVRFDLPLLFGLGAEYHVDSRLSVTLDARLGPDLEFERGAAERTQLAFRILAGIAYKF